MEETYEGWSNRETWAINLHISNNEGDYRYFCDVARECIEDTEGNVHRGHGERGRRYRSVCRTDSRRGPKKYLIRSSIPKRRAGYANTNEEARMFVSDVGSWWRADFYEIAEG